VKRLASALVLTATLAFVAAGCGQSPEEKWASSVCTDIGNWKSQVQKSTNEIRDKLQSPQAGMLAAIDADIQEALDATRELASKLKATEPPDTDSGQQAKQQVDALASRLAATVASAKQTVEGVPKNADLGQTLQKLAPLAPQLQSLAVNASSTLAAVQENDKKLKEGFDKADSCKQFRD
jgi:ABC-type transporter Mla subunit MlaD